MNSGTTPQTAIAKPCIISCPIFFSFLTQSACVNVFPTYITPEETDLWPTTA